MSELAGFTPLHTMHEYSRGYYVAANYAHGLLSYEKAVYKLGKLGTAALTMMGDVHLQEATTNSEATAELLDLATETYERRVYSGTMGYDPHAAIRLAQMPLYRTIIEQNEFPTEEDAAESYQMILWAASAAAEHYTYRDRSDRPEDQHLLSTLSDATGLLLTSRYALQHHLTSDWLPLLSLLKQDINVQGSGWDVSIMISLPNNSIELGHKLRVKGNRKYLQACNRDIASVAIDPDLKILKETRIKSSEIIAELQRDDSPFRTSRKTRDHIDRRTYKLLNILDRAK